MRMVEADLLETGSTAKLFNDHRTASMWDEFAGRSAGGHTVALSTST